MKKSLFVIILVLLPIIMLAQQKSNKSNYEVRAYLVGADGSDYYNYVLGLDFTYRYNVLKQLALGAGVGYEFYNQSLDGFNSTVNTYTIPFYANVQLQLPVSISNYFVAGVDIGGSAFTKNNVKVRGVFSPNLGFKFRITKKGGFLTLRGVYKTILSKDVDFNAFGAQIGFNF